jgi:hypothetical protein
MSKAPKTERVNFGLSAKKFNSLVGSDLKDDSIFLRDMAAKQRLVAKQLFQLASKSAPPKTKAFLPSHLSQIKMNPFKILVVGKNRKSAKPKSKMPSKKGSVKNKNILVNSSNKVGGNVLENLIELNDKFSSITKQLNKKKNYKKKTTYR